MRGVFSKISIIHPFSDPCMLLTDSYGGGLLSFFIWECVLMHANRRKNKHILCCTLCRPPKAFTNSSLAFLWWLLPAGKITTLHVVISLGQTKNSIIALTIIDHAILNARSHRLFIHTRVIIAHITIIITISTIKPGNRLTGKHSEAKWTYPFFNFWRYSLRLCIPNQNVQTIISTTHNNLMLKEKYFATANNMVYGTWHIP